MQRHIIEVPQGQDLVRSTVRIEDDPQPADGMEGFVALGRIIQDLAFTPQMLRHATDCPAEVHIHHDGTKWVVETVSFLTRAPDEAP
jgi:hypothetical protein